MLPWVLYMNGQNNGLNNESSKISVLLLIKAEITKYLARVQGIEIAPSELKFSVERPQNTEHGDVATNVSMVCASLLKEKTSPKIFAETICKFFNEEKLEQIEEKLGMPSFIAKYKLGNLTVAGPGFINIKLSPKWFEGELSKILGAEHVGKIERVSGGDGAPFANYRANSYGVNSAWKGKKVIIEHTDPNAFKVFHIGHLMSNSIGESIGRIIAHGGAHIVRMCYPSDIGLHIAKAIWAIKKAGTEAGVDSEARKIVGEMPPESAPLKEKTAFLGRAYVYGTEMYEKAEKSEQKTEAERSVISEIQAINNALFAGKDAELMKLYNTGRNWSFAHLAEIYKKLGTDFDKFIYESETADPGKKIVEQFTDDVDDDLKRDGKVFKKSDGAIAFKIEGHEKGLHTRVFINSQGLPTYEAKEIGLNIRKFLDFAPDRSIIITASEQNDYFKVIKEVLGRIGGHNNIDQGIGEKTTHIGHGMLRLADVNSAEGKTIKMSSRKGNVITGESLITEVEEMVREKMANREENKEISDADKEKIVSQIAVGAIKYSILRQSKGSDIIFNPETSISFEGDSGPYLQYTCVRAKSLVKKAESQKIMPAVLGDVFEKEMTSQSASSTLLKMLTAFPETVERAGEDKVFAPNYIATYATELASAFNTFYGAGSIIDSGDLAPFKVALTKATAKVLEEALYLIGIEVPERM